MTVFALESIVKITVKELDKKDSIRSSVISYGKKLYSINQMSGKI